MTWTGFVRDAETRLGLEAQIRLEIDGPAGLRYRGGGAADASGAFALSLPKGRPTSLTVMSAGHATFPAGREAGAALAAIAGLRTGPLTHDVALRRGATASGIAAGSDGHGVANLELQFRPDRGTPLAALTDASGRYRLDTLSVGRYRVSIVTPGWYLAASPAQFDVPEGSSAGPASVTFDVNVVSAGIVSGAVVLGDGSPAAAARVWLVGGAGVLRGARNVGRRLETFTAKDGTFTLDDVPPIGGVRVRAAWGDGEALPSDPLSLASGAVPPVRLVLGATVKLVGRVTDLRTGDPVAVARINVEAEGEPLARGGGGAMTDAEGRYEITNRIPGRWKIVVNKKPLYLAGVPKEIELTAGSTPFTVDLVLDPGLVIGGLVTEGDGTVLVGVKLVLTGAEDGAASGQTVTRNANSDANGLFRWAALRPGRYALALSRRGFAPLTVPLRGGEDRLRLVLAATPGTN